VDTSPCRSSTYRGRVVAPQRQITRSCTRLSERTRASLFRQLSALHRRDVSGPRPTLFGWTPERKTLHRRCCCRAILPHAHLRLRAAGFSTYRFVLPARRHHTVPPFYISVDQLRLWTLHAVAFNAPTATLRVPTPAMCCLTSAYAGSSRRSAMPYNAFADAERRCLSRSVRGLNSVATFWRAIPVCGSPLPTPMPMLLCCLPSLMACDLILWNEPSDAITRKGAEWTYAPCRV